MNQTNLLAVLHKNYQERSIREHRIITRAIAACFPTHSQDKIKMMTFYLQVREGSATIAAKQYSKHSFVIKFKQIENGCSATAQLMTANGIEIKDGQFVAILDYQKYMNIEAWGQSSIEKEISFWESSEYFCSMPRKKMYQILREAEVKVFKENEIAFFQGQVMTKTQSGSGVFVVRKGQFGYFRANQQGKEIQAFRYGPGSIFGAPEILQEDPTRKLTARCKTQKSVVYHISEQIFCRLVARYCENVIRNKQQKLFRYIESNKKRKDLMKSRSLSDALRKMNLISDKTTYSRQLMMTTQFETAKSAMLNSGRSDLPTIRSDVRRITKRDNLTAFRQSSKMQEEAARKTDYFSLRKDGPLKSYPMVSQRSNYETSEFKLLDKLLQNRREVGKQLIKVRNPIRENGVWRRDMISSFYRQSFFESVRRNPQSQQ